MVAVVLAGSPIWRFFSASFSTLPLGVAMSPPLLFIPTALALPFGGLPATNQSQAGRILAISLVPTARLKDIIAAFAQADATAQAVVDVLHESRFLATLCRAHGE